MAEGGRDAVRLVLVVNNLGVGGTERHVVRLVAGLRATGRWDISVYCLHRAGDFIPDVERLGIPVVGPSLPWSRSPLRLLRAVVWAATYLRRERSVIAHCYLEMGGFVGSIAARVAGVPHVITTRRMVYPDDGGVHLRRRMFNAIADWCSSAVITVTPEAARQAVREGTPPNKVVTVQNGVVVPDIQARQRRSTDGPVFGSVGSLLPIKGHRHLIDAVPAVLRALPGARFVLVGDGPEREGLERQAGELDVRNCVDFLGKRTDATNLLQNFDVFVLPSETEGMPNALQEAMATGLPVVATCVGGVPQLVQNGVTGILVPPRSAAALADALIALGGSPARWPVLGREARAEMTRRFAPQREIDETEGVYLRLLRALPATAPVSDLHVVR